jgi:light-regulated signal transduction histidine kinase (bacteriophytochrome)
MDVESKNPEMALPDLNSCEREPLHLLGTVEPNGVMLVLSEPPGRVLQASSNALSLLGITPEALVGMSPGDLFSPDDVQRLMAGSRDDGKRRYVGGLRTETGLKNFDALVHRNQGLLNYRTRTRLSRCIPEQPPGLLHNFDRCHGRSRRFPAVQRTSPAASGV